MFDVKAMYKRDLRNQILKIVLCLLGFYVIQTIVATTGLLLVSSLSALNGNAISQSGDAYNHLVGILN
ncbi:MAG: hypothetical protein LBH87_01720, partial [Coriobacteriales bacterium]|nr:hypothetical protein [Coriobacteriales bacterium]